MVSTSITRCVVDRPLTCPVEVRLRPTSAGLDTFIITNVAALLREEYMWLSPGIVPEEKWNSVHLLQGAVERIYVAECGEF